MTMTISRRKPLVRYWWFLFEMHLLTFSSGRYQASMLRSLKEVQSDDSVVGFYQATTLGAFFNQTLVETQAIHQDKLRHGGVIIVHGERIIINYTVGLSWETDLSQTARGNAHFRAFRLTRSFLDTYKKSNFSSARWLGCNPCILILLTVRESKVWLITD